MDISKLFPFFKVKNNKNDMEEKYKIVFEIAKQEYSCTLDRIRAIDDKAFKILTLIGVIISVFLACITITLSSKLIAQLDLYNLINFLLIFSLQLILMYKTSLSIKKVISLKPVGTMLTINNPNFNENITNYDLPAWYYYQIMLYNQCIDITTESITKKTEQLTRAIQTSFILFYVMLTTILFLVVGLTIKGYITIPISNLIPIIGLYFIYRSYRCNTTLFFLFLILLCSIFKLSLNFFYICVN